MLVSHSVHRVLIQPLALAFSFADEETGSQILRQVLRCSDRNLFLSIAGLGSVN